MGCRKVKLEREWKEFADIVTGGVVVCGYCRVVHTKNGDIPYEREIFNEEQNFVS